MSLHIIDVEQGTDAWHDARRGMVTASATGKLLTVSAPGADTYACPECEASAGDPCVSRARKEPTPIKTMHDRRTAVAAERAKTAPPVIEVARNETSRGVTATLVAERITGQTEETAMTPDMWRGVEREPYARDLYSGHYHHAEQIGFMVRTEDDWELGYSPDGLVGVDGLIEIKCPRAKQHLNTILADAVPSQYVAQLQAGLLVSGRQWIDYVSYHPGMPLFVKRVTADPAWFEAITAACIQFEENARQIVADYRARVADMPQTEPLDFEIKVA